MFEHFKNTQVRRQILVLMTTISLLLAVIMVGLTMLEQQGTGSGRGPVRTAALSVLNMAVGALLSSILAAGFLGLIFDLLYRQERPEAAIKILDPRQTRELHHDALRTTNIWYHNGHIGRWVRTEALSALTKSAQRKRTAHRAVLVILDPKDRELCQRFASYRTDLQATEQDLSGALDVQLELLATIVRAADASRRPFMTVQVHTKSKIGWSRLDASDMIAFRTNPGLSRGAVAYGRDAYPDDVGDYEMALASFDEIMEAEIPLALVHSSLPGSLTDLDEAALESFLADNGLDSVLAGRHLDRLLATVKSEFNVYRRR